MAISNQYIHINLTLKVTQIGGAYTGVLNSTYWGTGIDGGKSLSQIVKYMEVDGTQVQPYYGYAFDSYGNHTVILGFDPDVSYEYAFGTLMPFHNNENLVSITNIVWYGSGGDLTFVGANYLADREFDGCRNLSDITWTFGSQCIDDASPFTNCPNVSSVTLTTNCSSNIAGNAGLWQRYSPRSLIFGTTLQNWSFYPINDNALMGVGLTSFTIGGDNQISIGAGALAFNDKLKWIWLDTEYLPTIDPTTFQGIREGGVLYNPNNLDVSSWFTGSQYDLEYAGWTVVNESPYITVNPSSETVNYNDTQTHFIAISSNLDYTIISNSNKIYLEEVSGGFNYQWNDINGSHSTDKTASVTISCGAKSVVVNLTQRKKPLGTDFYLKPNKYVIGKNGGDYTLTFDWVNTELGDVFDFFEEGQFTITPYSYWGKAARSSYPYVENCAAYGGYFLYIPGTPVTYQIRKNQKTYQISLPAVDVDTYYKVTININTVGYDWYGWELTNWSWAFAQMGEDPKYRTGGDNDYRNKRVVNHCGGIWTSTRIHTSTNNKKLIAYDLYAEDLLNEVIQSNKESIIRYYGDESYIIDFTNETLRTYTNDAIVGHWIDITGEDFIIGAEHNLSNPLLFTRFNTTQTVNPVCGRTALEVGGNHFQYNTPNNVGVIGDLNSTWDTAIYADQANTIGGGRYTISFTQIWEPTGDQTYYHWPIYLGMMSGPSIEFTVDNENAAAIIGSDRAMIGNSFLSVDLSDSGIRIFPERTTAPSEGTTITFESNVDDYIVNTDLSYTTSGRYITVTVPPNTTTEVKTYYVGISDGVDTIYAQISQAAGEFNIIPESPYYGASGGNKTAQISTNLEYDHISISAPNWVLNPVLNDNTFSFTLNPNYTTTTRSGDVVFTAYDDENNVLFVKNWTLGQDCTRFSCMSSVYTDYRAKTINLNLSISDNITAGMVTISENMSWMTPTLNISNSSFTAAVTTNNEIGRRYGTMTVTVKNPNTQDIILTKEILIYQYSPMTDPIYENRWYPIGTEAMFTVPTNDDFVDYTVLIKDKDDNTLETYTGRAYREPDGYINVCMNDIVDNYLSSDLSSVFPVSNFNVVDNYRLVAEITTNLGDTETFVFMNSWIREESMIPVDSLQPAMWWRGAVSEPISDKFDSRQYLVFSWNEFGLSPSYTINGTTTVLSADTGNPLQVFADKIITTHPVTFSDAAGETFTYHPSCGDFALYYINAYGGWDSLLVKAKRTDNIQSYDYMKLRQFERGRYLNVITPTWDVYTDYGVRSDRMHHLLESPTVYLHNLETGDITKVLINETACEYKNRFANYTFKLVACLNNYRR